MFSAELFAVMNQGLRPYRPCIPRPGPRGCLCCTPDLHFPERCGQRETTIPPHLMLSSHSFIEQFFAFSENRPLVLPEPSETGDPGGEQVKPHKRLYIRTKRRYRQRGRPPANQPDGIRRPLARRPCVSGGSYDIDHSELLNFRQTPGDRATISVSAFRQLEPSKLVDWLPSALGNSLDAPVLHEIERLNLSGLSLECLLFHENAQPPVSNPEIFGELLKLSRRIYGLFLAEMIKTTCPLCHRRTNSLLARLEHTWTEHLRHRWFQCEIPTCQSRYATQQQLNLHRNREHAIFVVSE